MDTEGLDAGFYLVCYSTHFCRRTHKQFVECMDGSLARLIKVIIIMLHIDER